MPYIDRNPGSWILRCCRSRLILAVCGQARIGLYGVMMPYIICIRRELSSGVSAVGPLTLETRIRMDVAVPPKTGT